MDCVKIIRYFLLIIGLTAGIAVGSHSAHGATLGASLGAALDSPLTADEAYKLSVRQESSTTYSISWDIADGYYLYKDKFAVSPQPVRIQPSSNFVRNEDQFFGEQNIYYSYAQMLVSIDEDGNTGSIKDTAAANSKTLKISYQGCWEKGLCYPVQTKLVSIDNEDAAYLIAREATSADEAAVQAGRQSKINPSSISSGSISSQAPPSTIIFAGYDYYLAMLKDAAPPLILLLFFLAGLGLTFTPCVLPMLPIITGIITQRRSMPEQGAGNSASNGVSTTSFKMQILLALTYVAVMSITFSGLGMLSGLLGYGMREALGSTPFLLIMSGLIVMFALSMLNLYTLHIPTFISAPANRYLSSSSGVFGKAALWGFLSPLVVGTCLSAPLAAIMIYIAERGSPWFGAAALLALSWGMGIPLLLFAMGLGQLLPRAGAWLEKTRAIFAFILLGLAVFIISPLLPLVVELSLYFILLAIIVYFVVRMLAANRAFSQVFSRGLAISAAMLCFAALSFYTLTNYNVIPNYSKAVQEGGIKEGEFQWEGFQVAQSHPVLLDLIQQGKVDAKPQLIYYYADWCVSCREIEWLVFNDEDIKSQLSSFNLIKADITSTATSSRQMMEYFNIFGPPTIIFLDEEATQLKGLTLIGNFNKRMMTQRLSQIVN